MSDYTRGDDPVYNGFREGWKCPCDAKEETDELWAIVEGIPFDRLDAICEAERDALEKAGAQMPRWIPVSERLPENGRYLTCSVWYGKQMINIDSFSTDRSKVDDYDMRGLGAGFYNYHSESGYFPVDDITHWMPLPAPPEEGAEHD